MLLLSACSASSVLLGEGADSAWMSETVDGIEDTGTTATEPEADFDDTRVYNLDAVHAIDITVPEDGVRELRRDPFTYVEGAITLDGVEWPQVEVRLKGKLGSYRDLNGKAGFKVDLNALGGAQWEGQETLNIGNMVQDYSFTHLLGAFAVSRAAGVPAPRVAYAWVTFNGEDYGLYALVEEYDDVFLDAHFEDSSGNLYDGDYYLESDWSYTLVDFYSTVDDLFDLDEGVDVGLADIEAITDAVDGDDAGAKIDLDQHAVFWAIAAWTGHSDSYCYYSNNYRVYVDPSDGLARMMHWDPDWAFYDHTALAVPYGRVTQVCKRDEACHAAFLSALDAIDGQLADAGVVADVERAIELIAPYVEADPRREIAETDVWWWQDHQLRWFDDRAAYLDTVRGL